MLRPGDIFARIIQKLTGQSAKTCGRCSARIETMNTWAWWKCWLNRKTIATWLAEEARRRGHDIKESSALDLFKAAFKEGFARGRRRLDGQAAEGQAVSDRESANQLRQQRHGKPSASPL